MLFPLRNCFPQKIFLLSLICKILQNRNGTMKTTEYAKSTAEATPADENFYESVLRERSPLTGEISPPRYSLLPPPIAPKTLHEDGRGAFTVPGRKSWHWLAAAVLLTAVIVFLTLVNTTNAVDRSNRDTPGTTRQQK